MTRNEVHLLLEQGGNIAENQIKEQYSFYAQYDAEIKSWLFTMDHFGSEGEFYEMVDYFNKRLFN